MLRNYIIIALRNLYRNKLFSLINILGLSLGMAATLLITEFIVHELSFDSFHENRDQIYRVIIQEEKEGTMGYSSIITAAVGESIVREFPEAVSVCRFSSPHSAYFAYQDKNYYQEEITYADSSLFKIFSFDLIYGDALKCLVEPKSVVLALSTARKMFGDINPVGKVIRYNGSDQLLITGVVDDPPANSSITFDAVISFSTLYQMPGIYLGWDGGWNYTAFILLAKGNSPDDMKGRFGAFMEKHINYKYRQHGFILSLILQPLEELHLYSGRDYQLEGEGRLTNLLVFSSIALFILLIACFNFMNLSTARSVRRAKEVGIRKVVGANKQKIIGQFLGESLLISVFSLLLALIIVETFQPAFNRIIGRELHLFNQSGIIILLIFIAMILVTGLLAGSYPAFFMSRFQAIRVIKGNFVQRTGKPVFRNILVLVQFLISAFLITCTIVIQNQIRFLQTKDLGFNHENIYVIPLATNDARDAVEIFKSRIRGIPEVLGCGASKGLPGLGITMNGYLPEGLKEPILIHAMDVDDEYLDLMMIPLVQGEGFDKSTGMDSVNILINESLANSLGWDEPIGKSIHREVDMQVIGVVQDFHYAPLQQEIEPLLFTQVPWKGFHDLSVRVQKGKSKEALDKIKAEWEYMFPNESFEFFALEDYIAEAYQDISGLRRIFIYFSLLAIFVACMGLLGLSAYSAGQRSKEVGIRKVFGASNEDVIIKVAGDFLKWVVLANVIAFPLAWWAIETWLQNFAYRIEVSFMVLIYTLLITFGLSALTITLQIIQLARSNPAKILKDE